MTARRRLPDPPSELIELALQDLEIIENNDQYRINMSQWHTPAWAYFNKNKICSVCFAGSVMANTLKLDIQRLSHPLSFDLDTQNKLYALSCFVGGRIQAGLKHLGIENPAIDPDRVIASYHQLPAQFKTDMQDLANHFKKAGL